MSRFIFEKYSVWIIPVGIIAYSIGIVNMYIWLFLTSLYLIFLNRIEIGIFLLLVGSSLFGRMFASQTLYLGVIVSSLLIGIFLLHKELFEIVNRNPRTILFAFIFIFFFLICFLVSPMTDYGKDKILKLSVRTLIWITTFLIIAQDNRIDTKAYGFLFFFLTLFYISQASQLYHIQANSLLDFSSFRKGATLLGRSETKVGIVSWHTLGYLSLASCVFWIQ